MAFLSGMFGAPRKPFDPNDPSSVMGMVGSPAAAMPAQPQMGAGYGAVPNKPSFFGAGGAGRGIAGTIGDYLLQQDNMQPVYAPAMMQQRKLMMERYAPQHVGDNIVHLDPASGKYVADWPDPGKGQTPTDLERLAADAGYDPSSPEYQAGMRNAWTIKTTAPPLVQHKDDGSLEVYPAGMVPRTSSAPTSADPPVGTVYNGYSYKGDQPGGSKNPANWVQTGGAGPRVPARFPNSVMDAVISQESGGRPGVLGPQTQYGQAQGLTQVMPGTAQQMAAKLGIPWQPSLMTGKDPASAAYQRQMGQAYLDQGMAATGNLPDALRYYHGGPNRKLWGPKTNAYAQNVLARLGNR